VLWVLQGPGQDGGGNICNGTPDGTPEDAPYVCDEQRIDAIATAHCAIAASGKPQAELNKLRSGAYSSVIAGPCSASCTSECACNTQSMQCVPFWLANSSG
jgi:hypothetical protein